MAILRHYRSKMKQVLIVISALILVSTLLSSCGFRLRNQHTLPPQLSHLYMQSENPYGEFETELSQTLTSLGVTLLSRPDPTAVTLNILNTQLTHSRPSIGASNQARIYTFHFSVTYQMAIQQHLGEARHQHINTQQQLTLNADQVLDATDQTQWVAETLRREAINQLVNRLSSRQVSTTLATIRHNNPHKRRK